MPNGYTATTLVPGYKPEQFLLLPVATLDKVVHANPGAGGTAEKTANWRIIGLWAILIAGVLALGWMAWRLLVQMGKGDSPPQ